MVSKTVEFGPFTPQELESLVRELQLKNIPFEISKDEKAEGRFKQIDFSNLINQAHFRTKHYMAQVFYLTLAKSDVFKVSEKLEKFGFPTNFEDNPGELVQDERDDVFLKAKTEKKNFNRRMIAWLLVLGFLCLVVIGLAMRD